MSLFPYPPAPVDVADSIAQPTAQFKAEVRKVVLTLIFFGILYLAVFAASIAVTAGLVALGGVIVFYIHHFLAIVFALGLMAAGVMLLVFVLKFLFASKKNDQHGYEEITEEAYPMLFDFIRRISFETGTRFPKHIYLSAEVNAAVFYDSSFWSMIFPVRKNLVIGLGLVNMTNLSELKFVIAHEFGHFSQKSMRAGSYVYHANKVIYNMLFENDGYAATLNSIAGIHSAFALCARLTVSLVRAIQWILRQAYKVVNKQYMSLSRQMEFHADAVAAKVAGSNVAIHALRRIEFADACYNNVLENYNLWIPEKYKGGNVYHHQRIAASFIASDFQLPVVDGLPLLHEADKHYKSYSRISIVNQWASHPTRQQREEALQSLNVKGVEENTPSWLLFPDATPLQESFTNTLYAPVTFDGDPTTLPENVLIEKYQQDRLKYVYPTYYEGYYDARFIAVFDPHHLNQQRTDIHDISEFFKANKDTNARLEAAKADVAFVLQIADKNNGVRSFDFDGERYKRSQTDLVKDTLEFAIKGLENSLVLQDEQVYNFFILKAGNNSAYKDELRERYKNYFVLRKIATDNFDFCANISGILQNFYGVKTLEEALRLDAQLREATTLFKSRLEKVINEVAAIGQYSSYPQPEGMAPLKEKNWNFLANNTILEENLMELGKQIEIFGKWSYDIVFKAQKEILEKQELIMKEDFTVATV